MTRNDITIVCKDCGRSFVFRSDEQSFYAEKGYNEPTRCKDCRAARKISGPPGGRAPREGMPRDGVSRNGIPRAGKMFGGTQDRELFPATCASCGKQTQVPFRPKDGRPVFCRDCFSKNK